MNFLDDVDFEKLKKAQLLLSDALYLVNQVINKEAFERAEKGE